MKIIKNIVQFVKDLVLTYRVKRALSLAQKLSETNKRKYLVLMVAGVPKVYSKQELKMLIRRRKFVNGTTIQDLEKKAIAVTIPERCKPGRINGPMGILRGNANQVERIL